MVLPDGAHFATNAAMVGVMAAIAGAARMDVDELGLSPHRWRDGARWGVPIVVAIAVVVGAVGLAGVDPLGLLGDRASLDGGDVWFQVFVEIPIATVLFEELAFRGVIAGLLERVATPGRAILASSVLFGLWHLDPTALWSLDRIAGALGTVLATAAAGAVFHLLRRRSGSLLAPALAHWGTNGVALGAVWLATR